MWTKIMKYLLIIALATWWWPFAAISMITHAAEIVERDYNGDGYINIIDQQVWHNADVNKDGTVNELDVRAVQYVMSIHDNEPRCCDCQQEAVGIINGRWYCKECFHMSSGEVIEEWTE